MSRQLHDEFEAFCKQTGMKKTNACEKAIQEYMDVDPRYWFVGEAITLDRMIKIPADASGECTLYLNLPDPKVTLHDNPRFSIRLANEGVWDEETGYNKIATFTL